MRLRHFLSHLICAGATGCLSRCGRLVACLCYAGVYILGRRRLYPRHFVFANESEISKMNALSLRSRRSMTLADTLIAPRFADDRMLSLVSQLFLVIAGSALLAVSAQFAFRLPISPVPVTGQTLVVLMIGMAFGSRLGAATVMAYLIEGGMGLPVFANGAFGWPVLIGPTGGYLIGFVAAAFVIGYMAERGAGRGPVSTALAMLVGTAVIYLFGASWLAQFLGFEKALAVGVLPFLYGDALKLIVAAGLMPLAWRGVRLLSRGSDDNAA